MIAGRAHSRRRGCCLWLVAATWLLLAGAAQAGQVTVHAFLDRNQVQLGDTVTLNIEIDGATHVPAPDVSSLAPDFTVLGTSHNTSISIVNGARSVKSLWAIGLRPLHAGTITIPSLDVDGHATAPIKLVVGAAPATARGGPGDAAFIRVTPDTLTPYVGQQIGLIVRLFYTPNVTSGSLQVPYGHGTNVSVQQLGKGTRYEAQRGGRMYQVLERHYAVIAQHAGPLNLPPVTFTGSMMSNDQFSMFFGNGKTITARAAPIHLAIRARPAASGKGAWLPARKVTLQLAGLPPDGRVQAGQPLTLTLVETAVGLPFESLPEPRLPVLAGVDVYPDRSQDHTGDDGQWLEGTRTRKFALVPQRSGPLVIPAITLPWWNVQTDQAEVARIPAHTLEVVATTGVGSPPASSVPAPAATQAIPAPAQAPVAQPHAPAAQASVPAKAAPSGHWLAWLALALWLATVMLALAWWWLHRRRHAPAGRAAPPAPPPGRHLRQTFFEAARGGDAAGCCAALMAWARAERPDLRAPGDLAAALDSAAQRAAIANLQRARYAGAAAETVDADALLAAFQRGLAWRKATPATKPENALPPLYP